MADKVETTKKTWKEFRDSKLLWWINRILHTFGWAIIYQLNSDGEITEVFPARVTYRGFNEKNETEGFAGITQYLKDEISSIEKDIK